MEFGALAIYHYLPIEIASDLNKIKVSRKLKLRAFKRRKNRHNPMRSDGVNGLLKIVDIFVPQLNLKDKSFWKILDAIRNSVRNFVPLTFVENSL